MKRRFNRRRWAVAGGLLLTGEREPEHGGKTVTEWIRVFQTNGLSGLLDRPDRPENKAMRALGSRAVPYILKELKAEDSSVKRSTRRLLEKLSVNAVPLTTKQRREGARDALLAVRRVESKVAKGLIPLLDWEDEYIQAVVAEVLGASQNKEALPKLIEMTGSGSVRVRFYATAALGRYRNEGAVVVPVLVQMMGDSTHMVSSAAVRGLGRLGAESRSAIPDLIEALNNVSLQPSVAVALNQIDPSFDFENRVVPLLIAGLSKPGRGVGHGSYAFALGELGAKAASAIPA